MQSNLTLWSADMKSDTFLTVQRQLLFIVAQIYRWCAVGKYQTALFPRPFKTTRYSCKIQNKKVILFSILDEFRTTRICEKNVWHL